MHRHNWDYRAVFLALLLSCGTAFSQGTPSAVIGGPPQAGQITGIVPPANGGTGVNNGTNTLTWVGNNIFANLGITTGGSATNPHLAFQSTGVASGLYADSAGDIFFSTGDHKTLTLGNSSAIFYRSGSAAGMTLYLFQENAASINQQIGGLQFHGFNSNGAGSDIEYVACLGTQLVVTAGSEQGFGTCNVWDSGLVDSHSIFHWDLTGLWLHSGMVLERGTPGGGSTTLIDASNNFSANIYGQPSTQALAVTATAPAQATTTTAGNAVTISASNAVAGSSVSGAAAGAGVTITGGAAARLSTGTAVGGAVTLQGGASIGSGAAGVGGAISLTGGSGTNAGGGGRTGGDVTLTGGAISTSTISQITGAVTLVSGPTQNSSTAAQSHVSGLVSIATAVGGATSAVGSTGGVSGNGSFITGDGGAATASTGGIGGNSGVLTIGTGAGGAATGGSGTRTGGNSGNILLQIGAAGTGASGNGTQGSLQFAGVAATSAAQAGTYCGSASGASTSTVTIDTTLACLASAETGKDVWGDLPEPLAKIMALEPIDFTWKLDAPRAAGDPGNHYGLGAYKTGYVAEELIARDAEGNPRGWRQDAVVATLVGAVQEQQHEIILMRWVGGGVAFLLFLIVGDLYRRALTC